MGRLHLFLVRHGESVDNVAGLYAGARDSPLTSHGVLQTRRLGAHLANRGSEVGQIRHIFASNLQRASRTAEAIRESQTSPSTATSNTERKLEIVCLPELREKDFGSDEGKKFGTRSGAGEVKLADSESHDAMRARVDRFLNNHLLPILQTESPAEGTHSLVVVAHGIILNVLLKALASYLSPQNTSGLPIANEAQQAGAYMVPWSNTGYLEGVITVPRRNALDRLAPHLTKLSGDQSLPAGMPAADSAKLVESSPWSKFLFRVKTVNCIDHLQGLKKTRGGIGSAKFDEKQKTVTSFFTPLPKKRKAEEDPER